MPFDGSLSERLPTPDEREKANFATQILAKFVDKEGALHLNVDSDDSKIILELPPAISNIVIELLLSVAKGDMVTLVPTGAELSTQQAADILNVSRPFLIKLINKNEIDCHTVGTHRRLYAEDVLSYKKKRDLERKKTLKELARLGQEIDS